MDGSYALADLFSYIKCVKNEAKYNKCKDNKVFDPELQKCVHGSHLSLKTFCKNRADGNYQNPWDCNQFIQCVHRKAHVIACQADNLVYDPYLDTCRDNNHCQKLNCKYFQVFLITPLLVYEDVSIHVHELIHLHKQAEDVSIHVHDH